MRKTLFLALMGAALASTPAAGQPMRDSRDRIEAFRGVRQGDILPLSVIRDRIVPRMPGATLIGADLIGTIYRLRFMRGDSVMIVSVDGRTGQPFSCLGC